LLSRPIRLGARTSPLARAQAELVRSALAARGLDAVFVGITTQGDTDRRHLTEIGGAGVFTGAVRDALRAGTIDVGVHSLKDLPTAPEDDLEVVAIPEREDTRDVLVGRRLDDLRDGDRVGTGAPRRAIQLAEWAQSAGREVSAVPIRGNVDTRIELARRGDVAAVILAAAGLRRLGYLENAGTGDADTVVKNLQAEVLDHSVMLPAPGQGALACEISRSLGLALREAVAGLDHQTSRAESLAERGFLAALQAGCTAPVGARAVVKSVRGTSLDLTLAAVIGKTLLNNLSEPSKAGPTLRLQVDGSTTDAEEFGTACAGSALAKLREHPQQNARRQ
jgi:hydroxymethylbilane synthase